MQARQDRVYLRALVGLILAAHAVMFLWVVLGRARFPFDLEWMTGSVIDHVERVRQGQRVYVEPTAGFFPFLYPPLYYWICASLGGTVFVCRVVSLIATLVQVGAAFGVARALGAGRFWASVAAALVVASFSYSGGWYDLERADSLVGAFVAAATLLLVARTGRLAHAGAGLLLGVAFLAKQQAVFYLAGAGLGVLGSLWIPRDRIPWSSGIAFAGSAALGLCGGIAIAYAREGSWFVYYVFRMPSAHGIRFDLFSETIPRDVMVGFGFVASTIAFVAVTARRVLRRDVSRAALVFASVLGMGFVGAVASRLHIGGWINVLIPWTTFAAIAVSALGHEADASPPLARAFAVLLSAQLVIWMYDPSTLIPSRRVRARFETFERRVYAMEASGPVLVPSRGHLTRTRRFHIAALADLVTVESHSPEALRIALESRTFAAVIDDAWPQGMTPSTTWPPVMLEDIADLHDLLLRNYFISERIDDDLIRVQLPAPALPRWVYLPRRTPLPVSTPREELRRRQLAEMALAAERAPSSEIEDLAAVTERRDRR